MAQRIAAAGGKARAIACHIGDMDALSALFTTVEQEHGRLDVLVNNAATNPYYGHVLDTDLAAFQKTVDVNIRGYFFASVLGGRLMRKTGGGSIINIASINAIRPGPLQGIYSITKGAVLNLTKVFARECGPDGIRVNAILPGLVRTKFAGALLSDPAQVEHYVGQTPLRRVGEPATSPAPPYSSPRTPRPTSPASSSSWTAASSSDRLENRLRARLGIDNLALSRINAAPRSAARRPRLAP